MIIDVHAHIGRLENPEAETLGLANYISAANIETIFVSNLHAARVGNFACDLDETEANLATLRIAEPNPRVHALYWARPGCPDSHPQAVMGALSQSPFFGLVLAPKHGDYLADDPRVDPYVQIASRFRIPVLILSSRDEQSRPRRIYQLARRFPRQVFVVLNADADAHWREAVDCAQKSISDNDSRLYLETAHIPPDEIAAALRVIRPERILFGSDVNLSVPENETKAVIRQLEQALAGCSRKVMFENAAEMFDLAVKTPS